MTEAQLYDIKFLLAIVWGTAAGDHHATAIVALIFAFYFAYRGYQAEKHEAATRLFLGIGAAPSESVEGRDQ